MVEMHDYNASFVHDGEVITLLVVDTVDDVQPVHYFGHDNQFVIADVVGQDASVLDHLQHLVRQCKMQLFDVQHLAQAQRVHSSPLQCLRD